MKARMMTALLLLLAAVFGWFLPSAVTTVSDRTQEGWIETLELEPISLQYHDALEKLEWFGEIYHKNLRLHLLSGQLLKSSEAAKIATEFMMQTGLCEQVSVEMIRVEFQNVAVGGTGYSMIFWELHLILDDDAGKSAYVMIDDASGLILGFSINVGSTQYDMEAVMATYTSHLLTTVGEGCQVNYELVSRKDHNPTYRLTIQNGESTVSGLKLLFSETISFNSPTIEN